MNKYEIVGIVGEGAYGIVYKAKNKDTGEFGKSRARVRLLVAPLSLQFKFMGLIFENQQKSTYF